MRIASSVMLNVKDTQYTPCYNRTQSRVVIGLLTGHNTLRRHLHLLGLTSSRLCKRCGEDAETSANILCEREALASLRHTYLGSVFLYLEDVRSQSLGGKFGTLAKKQGSLLLLSDYGTQRARYET
jgi:hypothetical protein